MIPSPVKYMRENGPSAHSELPNSPTYDSRRYYGIRRVKIEGSPVYYLPEHDPKDVIRKYIEENPKFIEGSTKSSVSRLLGNHSKELSEAWREIVNEYDLKQVDTGQSNEPGGLCPLCGNQYTQHLADHLPKCEARG